MAEKNKKQCPTCMGMKVIPGVCESSQEWSGTSDQDEMQCTPEEDCPTCEGTGYIFEE